MRMTSLERSSLESAPQTSKIPTTHGSRKMRQQEALANHWGHLLWQTFEKSAWFATFRVDFAWSQGETCPTSPCSSVFGFRLHFPIIGSSETSHHFCGHVMPQQSKYIVPTIPLLLLHGDLGSSVPETCHRASPLLVVICAIWHILDTGCHYPQGEIWLHLGNKLENWAIIEWTGLMWAVYLNSMGPKPSE